jgi:CBS domain-containing protein
MTSDVVTATPETPLPDLVDDMVWKAISCVPIVRGDTLVGIVTEADLVSKVALAGAPRRRLLSLVSDLFHGRSRQWIDKARGRTAADVMTTDIVVAAPSESIRVVAMRMLDAGVKRMPVVIDDNRLVGIVSRADVLRAMHGSDAELAADIGEMLTDPIRVPDATAVTATVRSGVVTLRGTVRYPMDLPVLDSMVWRFPGVVDVVNEVTSTEQNPTSWQPPPMW